MADELLSTLDQMGVDVWVPHTPVLREESDSPAPLSAAPLPRGERMADLSPEGLGNFVFHYQSDPAADTLVICDQASMDCWPEARKLLANILYFLDLKPGQYDIAKPGFENTGSEINALVNQMPIKSVLNFGCEHIKLDQYPEIRYVELCSLAILLQEPLRKKQVLDALIKFKH